MTAVLLRPEHHWTCPNCTATDVTYETQPHARFHSCAGLKGLSAPFVPEGLACKVVTEERGDYVGRDLVQVDGDGRPIMAVVTVRDDGEDRAVLAPTAVLTMEDLG